MARLRRVDCSSSGIRRVGRGRGFCYEEADGDHDRRPRGDRADPRARDPAGVEGGLDLPAPERPHPGDRDRRRRAASSTSTTRTGARAATARSSPRCSDFAAVAAADARAARRPTSRGAAWRASACSPARCGCSTSASSGSAASATRRRTRPSGSRRCAATRRRSSGGVAVLRLQGQGRAAPHQEIADPAVVPTIRALKAARRRRPRAARLPRGARAWATSRRPRSTST